MSVEGASAWAEWMTQKFGEGGAGILSGSGVFEVIRCDRWRLPAECCIPPRCRLCINIFPLLLVTSCLLHPEQAGHHDPTTIPRF